jgi:hypothetical protein
MLKYNIAVINFVCFIQNVSLAEIMKETDAWLQRKENYRKILQQSCNKVSRVEANQMLHHLRSG